MIREPLREIQDTRQREGYKDNSWPPSANSQMPVHEMTGTVLTLQETRLVEAEDQLPAANSVYNHIVPFHHLSWVLLCGSESQFLPVLIERQPHEGVRCGHGSWHHMSVLESVHHGISWRPVLKVQRLIFLTATHWVYKNSIKPLLRTEVPALNIPV